LVLRSATRHAPTCYVATRFGDLWWDLMGVLCWWDLVRSGGRWDVGYSGVSDLPPKACRKTHSVLFRDPLISPGGCLRPSCARPLGGPRISSAAWHRLVWLLATCVGRAPLDHSASPVYPSCLHLLGAGVPTRYSLLGAPPTGGTHCESNAPPGPMPVASGR
jgi:hypothetical protein